MKHKNSCILIDYMGSDNSHCLAAWASTFAELDIEMPEDIEPRVDLLVNHILNNGKRKRTVNELLGFLAQNEHTSPFRFSSFVFACTTDIATHIQKLKHSVILSAENGESARYKELKEDKFYLPEEFKTVPVSNDNIKNEFGTDNWYNVLESVSNKTNELYHECLKDCKSVLISKRAKETARYFKLYNSQLNTFNKFSFDGIMQFYFKRGNPSVAQNEIAELASQMVNEVRNIAGNPFRYSLAAFGLGPA